jgi:hypothetical protein
MQTSQCCGSVIFWYGSERIRICTSDNDPDSDPNTTPDPDPDPGILVSGDLQDDN